MLEFLIRRTFTGVLTVLGALVALFIMIQFIPGNPAAILLGQKATPQMIEAMRERMGLDLPLHVQLGKYLLQIARGDLGTDVLTYMPVSTLVIQALPNTIILAFSSIILGALIGLPLGIHSAAYRNSLVDKITGVVSVAAITVPHFLRAVLLLVIFTLTLRWFPAKGAGEQGDILDQLWHLVLPAFTLAMGQIGYTARLMRATVLEELGADYVRTARAKGLPERITLYKHAGRAALPPVVAILAVGFGRLLGGAVLVEIVFHRPGLGFLIYNGIKSRNYPIVQGGLIVSVFLYVAVSILAYLSHAFTDPRIRLG